MCFTHVHPVDRVAPNMSAQGRAAGPHLSDGLGRIGFPAKGCRRQTPQVEAQIIQEKVEQRDHEQRQQGRHHQTADHGDPQQRIRMWQRMTGAAFRLYRK